MRRLWYLAPPTGTSGKFSGGSKIILRLFIPAPRFLDVNFILICFCSIKSWHEAPLPFFNLIQRAAIFSGSCIQTLFQTQTLL